MQPGAICATTEQVILMEQRRRYSRVDFVAKCSLLVEGQVYETTLADISMKGALVERPESWEDAPRRKCKLLIELDAGTILTMEMEEARIVDGRLGLVCVSIDIDSATHLRRLLELNFGDPALVERELVQR